MFCNKSIFLSMIYTHNLPHYSFLGMRFVAVRQIKPDFTTDNVKGLI
ncbi:hypothetical protein SAMN04487902_102201 [Prevotella sp. ne3005]|nr:hypothetical protein SAMN04487902_102201 [Prevotella sp. ne3005]